MGDFYRVLLAEQERLEQIYQKVAERLEDVPEGSLHISGNRKWFQCYQRMPREKGKGTYIPKKNMDLIRRLAQKEYDEKIRRLVERRLRQVKMIMKDYTEDEIEKIFLKTHKEKKKWIRPVEKDWEQQLDEWIAEEYQGKAFSEETAMILTEKGERVRSKSEKILADYFYRSGIPYKYEKPLHLKKRGLVIYPDFTFLSRKTGQEIYWEHDGRMDDPDYAQNAIRKRQLYEDSGIYPGERLILTFETGKTVLNMGLAEKLAERYLQ